jgi:hypothetical protein
MYLVYGTVPPFDMYLVYGTVVERSVPSVRDRPVPSVRDTLYLVYGTGFCFS